LKSSLFRKNEAEYQDNYFAYKPGGTIKDIIEISKIDNRLSVENHPYNSIFSRSLYNYRL